MTKTTAALLLLFILPLIHPLHAFAPSSCQGSDIVHRRRRRASSSSPLLRAINQKRRRELGLPDDADEYDLDVALNNNTDAGITKIVAGSFILVMIALLVVGLV
ncbi:hypothetical protein ACHAW5_006228 [Stephanodiscus triporus]|uniref:Uncharacterized protein n=1 Tax=Stephanodiscus triporus TaxID=2934178 RepID=A0ABD3NM48_9STRA